MNLFKADTSIKRTQAPKKYLKWSFLLLPTCINSIPPLNMPVTGNEKDCLELPPTNFSIFTLKKRNLTKLFY